MSRLAPGPLRWIREAAEGDGDREAEMVARWQAGEPLQYVLGQWAFRNQELTVDRRALIPRPETEWLVEVVLGLAGVVRRAVDLGTGTGAIALSLADAYSEAEVFAVEHSDESRALAEQNLAETGVKVLAGSWFEPLPAETKAGFDLIVSNPPYVSDAEWAELEPVVRDWEPRFALVAGPSGRECLELIVDESPHWLAPGGLLALEGAPHQMATIARRCEAAGLDDVSIHLDLAGRERVVTARRSGPARS